MNLKFIGGVLLIVGTSIGGGMLALPIGNASVGFWQSASFLLICWAMMTMGALFTLEANLYLPAGKNIISMATVTLGKPGCLLAWFSYLFLLYTLLAGYISGGADIFATLTNFAGFSLGEVGSALWFTLIFGIIVYGGIHRVDVFNRALMFAKLTVYVLLIFLISRHIHPANLTGGNARQITGSIMLLITSFGYAIILPDLRSYFDDDIPSLLRVIFIGSAIPLFCYLLWDAVIMGLIPAQQLGALMQSQHATSELATMVEQSIRSTFISRSFDLFTSICMLTAFLGVALCLMSFLADGLGMVKRGYRGILLAALTFAPPLLIVLYQPGIYIRALNYAGIFCVILLLLLPALMTVRGRKKYNCSFKVPGGMVTQGIVILFSFVLLLNSLRSV